MKEIFNINNFNAEYFPQISSVEIIKLTKEIKKKDLFYGHEIIKRFGLWTSRLQLSESDVALSADPPTAPERLEKDIPFTELGCGAHKTIPIPPI